MRTLSFFKAHMLVIRFRIWMCISFERKILFGHIVHIVQVMCPKTYHRENFFGWFDETPQITIFNFSRYALCMVCMVSLKTFVLRRNSKDIRLAMSSSANLVILKNMCLRKLVMRALGKKSTVLLLNAMPRKIMRIVDIMLNKILNSAKGTLWKAVSNRLLQLCWSG
jgi:hypothetical protein